MSKGLGNRQRLFLTALLDLERQHGVGWYRTSHIVRHAFEIAGDLKDAAAAYAADQAALVDRLEREAANGDELARHTLLLREMLRRRPTQNDNSRRGVDIERKVNPSRVLTLLAARRLIERGYPQGRFRLTDNGRAAVSVGLLLRAGADAASPVAP